MPVFTGEMREKAASPTVFWPPLKEAGGNWNGQEVPASLGIILGSTVSLWETGGERDGFSAVSRSS